MSCIKDELKEAYERSRTIAGQHDVMGKTWVRDECIGNRRYSTYVSVEPKDSRTLEEKVKDLEESVCILRSELYSTQRRISEECKSDTKLVRRWI